MYCEGGRCACGAATATFACRAERRGLHLALTVSKTTKLLIQGSARGTSRKRTKAETLQVPVIDSSEGLAELVAMIREQT